MFSCSEWLALPISISMCMCAQLCLTLHNPLDYSLPASFVHVILQEKILEYLSFPPPGDLPNPGIKPESPALAGRFFNHEATWEACP